VPVARKQTKLRRLSRLAVTLVCAYALALTVILSGWTGAAASGGLSAICSEHTTETTVPPAGGDKHHGLCAMLCSLQAAGIAAAPAPSSIVLHRPLLVAEAAPPRIEQIDPRSYFPKDHLVRGPPQRSAA
jgi:hypothetical protein